MNRKEFLSKPEIVTEINRMMRTRSRSTLVTMCTTAGVTNTGSKHEMATRLVMVEHKVMEPQQSMLDRIRKAQPSIVLTRLPDGHFWYKEAGLVFHKDTHKVFRICTRIDPEPEYLDLDRAALDYCREYKILYQIPETITDGGGNRKDSTEKEDEKTTAWRPLLPNKLEENVEVDIEDAEEEEEEDAEES